MPPIRKKPPPAQVVRRERPPPSEERRIPTHGRRMVTSKIIKPVGAALFLFALAAHAQQTITAPQGGAGACPFPACRGTLDAAIVTDPPWTAPLAPATATTQIQAAIDSGAGLVLFPPGTFLVCGLLIRAPNQLWRGAGAGATILKGTPNCTNVILTSSTGGPGLIWGLQDLTLVSANSTSLVNLNGRDVVRADIRRTAFDLGSATGDTQGVIVAGTGAVTLADNEFYSSVPGHGKAIVAFRNPAHLQVTNNRIRWTYQGVEWGTEGTDGAQIVGNDLLLGWPFLPIKTANSGGTVTYTDGVLTDTAASFAGLCNDTGTPPATCGGGLGNHLRVLTPLITGSGAQAYNNGGNIITDTGVTFTAAKEGDLVVTGPVCRGGTPRGTCGATGKGDRCDCATGADCTSGVCEPRFSWVIRVNDATHLAVEEWMGMTDRRPVGAPLTAPYTVSSWVTCTVGSYTTTTVNCSNLTQAHFKDPFGTVVTPAAGTRYEIETRHPNYPLLENPAASHSLIQSNVITWGYSDNIFATGFAPKVLDNIVENGWDHCYNLAGAYAIISGNLARHCGARGLANFSAYSVMTNNIAMDTPWTAVGSSNCPIVMGLLGAFPLTAVNNRAVTQAAMTGTTSGHCVQNNSDGVILDGATCQGTFTTACIRNDTVNNVRTHIQNYHGETISNNGGTFSLEGGLATQAQITASAALNGSTLGCSDCTVASPTLSGGTGAIAIRAGGAWNGK